MNKKIFILLFACYCSFLAEAQNQVYFNNIYQHGNNFASGKSILEFNNSYIGYGSTEDEGNIGQMLLLFKINKLGEEIIWKPFGEDYHTYFPGNVGGALIKTIDEKFALAYHADYEGIAYSSLIKFDSNLDTIWKRNYSTENLWTMTMNCSQTNDNGFILTGSVKPAVGEYWDFLIIKTDSSGNQEWYQTYGAEWSEHGENTIQTPDGGYLIGGYFWKPGYDHSLDAMVIKTDSLGNEEWTKYYGNPDVDDDMALVAMADDGNYLVATVYGDEIMSSMYREGRVWIMKIDTNGNIIEEIKYGPSTISNQIKNMRKLENGNYISSGFKFSYTDEHFKGWIFNFSENLDSNWMRDYYHYNGFQDINYFYDASPTSDNGYIAIGKARPDMGGSTNKMWIVKVDSLGCDTPGCFTTVISEEWLVKSEGTLRVWPNPTKNKLKVESKKFKVKGTKYIHIYNSLGLKVEEIEVPEGVEGMEVDVSKYTSGLYYLQYIHSGKIIETIKFIKN